MHNMYVQLLDTISDCIVTTLLNVCVYFSISVSVTDCAKYRYSQIILPSLVVSLKQSNQNLHEHMHSLLSLAIFKQSIQEYEHIRQCRTSLGTVALKIDHLNLVTPQQIGRRGAGKQHSETGAQSHSHNTRNRRHND